MEGSIMMITKVFFFCFFLFFKQNIQIILRFVVLTKVLTNLTHIFQGYFNATEAIM